MLEPVVLRIAEFAERLTDTAAIVIVAYGVIEAFVRLLGIMARPRASHGERKVVWRRFGVWLLLGLEFELAADIILFLASAAAAPAVPLVNYLMPFDEMMMRGVQTLLHM